MSERPSFQFYPGDWVKNANLRRCSPAARGVWLDVMCVLHDQAEYGIARWPLKEIARAAAASMTHLRELVEKNVLKGIEKGDCKAFVYVPRSGRKDGSPVTLVPIQAGPIWYSSRMVRDEYVRTIRAESGTSGASPKHSPKPPKGDTKDAAEGGGFGPRGSSSSSSPSGGNTSDPVGSGGTPPTAPPLAPTAPLQPMQDDLYGDPPPDPAPVKPVDVIFGLGLPLLVKAGIPDKQARTFLGLQRKGGDERLVEAIRSAIETQALQPLEFIAGCMNVKPTKASSHAGFQAKDYHAGANEDGSF